MPIKHTKRQLFKVVKKARPALLNNLMGALLISCPDASVFQYVDVDMSPNYTPSDYVNVSCTVDVSTSEEVQPQNTLTEAALDVNSTEELVGKLVYPVEAVEKLAQLTTGQTDNPLWFEHRKGRITGSSMHAVYTKVNSILKKSC